MDAGECARGRRIGSRRGAETRRWSARGIVGRASGQSLSGSLGFHGLADARRRQKHAASLRVSAPLREPIFFEHGGCGPGLPLSRENGFAKGSGDGPGGVRFEARRLSDRRDHDAVDDVHHAVRLRSEEHTSELQSLMRISYAVFCLKKKRILEQNSSKRTTNFSTRLY